VEAKKQDSQSEGTLALSLASPYSMDTQSLGVNPDHTL